MSQSFQGVAELLRSCYGVAATPKQKACWDAVYSVELGLVTSKMYQRGVLKCKRQKLFGKRRQQAVFNQNVPTVELASLSWSLLLLPL